jgi:hypothetical protein
VGGGPHVGLRVVIDVGCLPLGLRPVLGLEGRIDLEQGCSLTLAQREIGGDGGRDRLVALALVEDPRLDVQGLRGPWAIRVRISALGFRSPRSTWLRYGLETSAALANCRSDICA